MQLFILDYSPVVSARSLCDKHLRKMCLETAQILSSVMATLNLPLSGNMPRPYNALHPVIKALNSPVKVDYAVIYNASLQTEYKCRFGKSHAYAELSQLYWRKLFNGNFIFLPQECTFARAFKDIEITQKDIVLAYRIYYRYKKTQIADWRYTNSAEPKWLTDGL
jgi:hypothetical protein